VRTFSRRGKNGKVTWYVDYAYQGKRHRRKVGTSRAVARLTANRLELQIERGENLGIHEQPRVLFRDYASEYLEFSKASKSHKSWIRDRVSLHSLVPVFGDIYLFAISPRQVEEYRRRRLEKDGRQPATINRELACLRHMFNKAIEWGKVKESPVKGIKLFREPPGRIRYLEASEIEDLLRECSPRLRPIVITALNAGMRLSEILNLRWASVNMRTRIITIEHTKSGERRTIPINATLYQELRKLSLGRQSEFVFPSAEGRPLVNIRRGFMAACARAGLVDFRFHDLRHTFASHLVMAGVNLKAVQELLGHKGLKMTMRYSHLSQEHLQEAVGRLNHSLSGEMQKQFRAARGKK